MATDEQFIPRNYRLGILNGALFMGGTAFLDQQAVVAVFLVALGASRFVVGLASAAAVVGFLLPTLLIAHPIETAERKLPYYYLSTVTRTLALGGLAAATLCLGRSHPVLLSGLTVVLLCGFNASIGVGVLPFYEVVGHSVPARRRGRFAAWRMVLGSSLAIGSGLLVKWLLDEERSGLTFSQGFASSFALGMLLCGMGSLVFCLVREPAIPVDRRGMGLLAKLREGWELTRRDASYRRLLVCRVAMSATAVASPFYVLYCLDELSAPRERAAIFLIVARLTSLAAYPVCARVSDGRGNARLLRLASLLALAPPLLAMALRLLPADAVTMRWSFAVALYVAATAALSGYNVGATNYVMELAPRERRPLYIAMGYAWVTPIVLVAAPLGGWLADTFAGGRMVTFAMAAVFGIVAAAAAFGLHEPRESAHVPE